MVIQESISAQLGERKKQIEERKKKKENKRVPHRYVSVYMHATIFAEIRETEIDRQTDRRTEEIRRVKYKSR